MGGQDMVSGGAGGLFDVEKDEAVLRQQGAGAGQDALVGEIRMNSRGWLVRTAEQAGRGEQAAQRRERMPGQPGPVSWEPAFGHAARIRLRLAGKIGTPHTQKPMRDRADRTVLTSGGVQSVAMPRKYMENLVICWFALFSR